MKTFETEKGNIPEGATHYRNEDKNSLFTWLKVSDDIKLWCDILDDWRGIGSHVNCIMDKITPIPQTKEVEWVNGDTAYVKGCSHDEITFIGLAMNKNVAICECVTSGRAVILDRFWVLDLLKEKPETEAERKEREELEAAYDLLCVGNRALSVTAPCTFDEFKLDKPQCDFWLSIVRKTNYKVKGE
ncbi:hypothetical protein NVP1177O_07 [Vibrio phage 1.177.O._10N.286.45.E10]|nr:hypothetical protein NVP1177O_07 [Vibrio phage 1.177.O._10N.286.45.E10]